MFVGILTENRGHGQLHTSFISDLLDRSEMHRLVRAFDLLPGLRKSWVGHDLDEPEIFLGNPEICLKMNYL